MHPAIAYKRDAIAEVCRRYGVRRLEAFGSAARGLDIDADGSDADFLVEFGAEPTLRPLPHNFGFAEQLQALLGRPVDLVEAKSVRDPYLREAIDQDRELVFEGLRYRS